MQVAFMDFVKDVKRFSSVLSAMRDCPQNDKQSVLDHGRAVQGRSIALIHYLQTENDKYLKGFRVPEWFVKYRSALLENLAPFVAIMAYTEMHDCGKPFCRFIDVNGKQHFPNHAEVSEAIWKTIGCDIESDRIGQLILHDMDFHVLRPDDVPVFVANKDAPTLMLVGLAEIHANAEMFGGLDSQGFKIKFAQIDRRGKSACKMLYGDV
jgi:hypothetical protein